MQAVQVWLFGSALRSDSPGDLDILLIYGDRSAVLALRQMKSWEDYSPPIHFIAMTQLEEYEYDFIAKTEALRLL
ncbi:hypothetical protein ACWDD9_43230 [Kitasatospora sp. NPDC001119]